MTPVEGYYLRACYRWSARLADLVALTCLGFMIWVACDSHLADKHGDGAFLLANLILLLASIVGSGFREFSRFVVETALKRDEILKLATEQAERIRQLEQQVAALVVATSAPRERTE